MREFRIMLDDNAPHLSRFTEVFDGVERTLTFGAIEDLIGSMRYGASAKLAHAAAMKLEINQTVFCRSGGTEHYFAISEHDQDAHGNIRLYGRECNQEGVINPGATPVWIHAPHLMELVKTPSHGTRCHTAASDLPEESADLECILVGTGPKRSLEETRPKVAAHLIDDNIEAGSCPSSPSSPSL